MNLRHLGSPSLAFLLLFLSLPLLATPAAASTGAAPSPVWQYAPTDGAVYGSALSPDGRDLVLVLGYGFDPGGTILSLDPASGEARWAVDIPESPSSAPVIADGVVYAGIGTLVSGDSAVYALDLVSGRQIWRTDVTNRDLPATPVDGIAVAGDTIYLNRADGVVLALDAGTGDLRWEATLDKPPRGAPAVAGEMVFISTGFDGAAILALDVATGQPRWRVEGPANPVTGPVVAGETLYVGFIDGDLVAFDSTTGTERWRSPVGARSEDDVAPPSPGLPVVSDGMVYISANGFSGASTSAFDAVTGTPLWQTQTGGFSASAPALDGNSLFVGSDNGDLLGLDAASGTELWRVPIPNKFDIDLDQATPPLIDTERVYSADDAGGFVALDRGTG